jgi:ribosomal protein L11 methyltransferase
MWRLELALPDERAAMAAALAFETCAASVSAFEASSGWIVEGLTDGKPDRAALAAAWALTARDLGAGAAALLGDLRIERLAPRDWIAENQQGFPPLRIGRFFIHGSHVEPPPRAGVIALRIDAAMAFGTGEHATTRGCLMAMERLARRRVRRALDMGTGTGILAMAAARLWRCPVLACDIDGGAVQAAGENSAANGVRNRVRLRRSNGYRDAAVRGGRPFDLIVANILARPLKAMAGDLARHLAPDGVAILSGLLARQSAMVLAAHRARGLHLCRRIAVEGWETLVLERRSD